MKRLHVLTLLAICLALLSSCRTQRALWIETDRNGHLVAIAVTEGIARRFLETTGPSTDLWTQGEQSPIAREMLRDVLDGRQTRVSARGDDGSVITISMKPLSVPGRGRGNNRIVLEISKAGEKTFRLALSDLDLHLADENTSVSLQAHLDWKRWVPFLAREGGAVYVKDAGEDTEVWLYVE